MYAMVLREVATFPLILFVSLFCLSASGALAERASGAFAGRTETGYVDIPADEPTALLRSELVARWDSEGLPLVDLRRPETHALAEAQVRYRRERSGDWVYEILAVPDSRGGFPVAQRGNYIVKRDAATGEWAQVKVYLRNEAGFSLRVTPRPVGRGSLVSAEVAGVTVAEALPIPLDLRAVVSSPYATLQSLLGSSVPWGMYAPPADSLQTQAATEFVAEIRSRLSTLPDAEDGALDSDGRFVSIETLSEMSSGGLNCSGFAKWVVDGCVAPLTGDYLSVSDLKRKLPETRGNPWSARYEDSRDPYFGLDWTRNLYLAYAAARGEPPTGPEAGDVREIAYADYTEDLGFSVDDLAYALYVSAVRNPGFFYLGSVVGPFGSDPILLQHYHVVVLIPFFDSEGRFHIVLFERNTEQPFAGLSSRYPDEHLHLVALPIPNDFNPPLIER